MNDYKPNSNRFKEEQATGKRIEPVVSGTARVKKRSDISKVAKVFISEDVGNVKQYLLMDVLVPTIKKAIMSTLDMILNGGSVNYGSKGSSSKVSYRKYYDDPRDDRKHSDSSAKPRSRFDDEVIEFETRGQAETVLNLMEEAIERYGFVTVADMYDAANLTAPYTSNKYGWMNLRNAEVVRLISGGYTIKLPKISPID